MIKKILGLEDPLIEKIDSKYGENLGSNWKWSNLLGRIFIFSIVMIFILLIPLLLSGSSGLDAEDGIFYLVRSVVPLILLPLLMTTGLSILGFVIATIHLAYKMKDNNWAIGLVITFFLFGGLGILIAFLYKYTKGNELKKI